MLSGCRYARPVTAAKTPSYAGHSSSLARVDQHTAERAVRKMLEAILEADGLLADFAIGAVHAEPDRNTVGGRQRWRVTANLRVPMVWHSDVEPTRSVDRGNLAKLEQCVKEHVSTRRKNPGAMRISKWDWPSDDPDPDTTPADADWTGTLLVIVH